MSQHERDAIIKDELSRIDGALNLSKHHKMATSPFHFLRGSAQLFYRDLYDAHLPIPGALLDLPLTTVIGDCHVSNFGLLTEQGSHSQSIIFSPNDFDDACIGHAVWDLTRFIVSLYLSADYATGLLSGSYTNDIDLDNKTHYKAASSQQTQTAASHFLTSYLHTCQNIIDRPILRLDAMENCSAYHVLAPFYRKAQERVCGGKKFAEKSRLAKAVFIQNDQAQFRRDDSKFTSIDDDLYQRMVQTFRPYMDDAILGPVDLCCSDLCSALNSAARGTRSAVWLFQISDK